MEHQEAIDIAKKLIVYLIQLRSLSIEFPIFHCGKQYLVKIKEYDMPTAKYAPDNELFPPSASDWRPTLDAACRDIQQHDIPKDKAVRIHDLMNKAGILLNREASDAEGEALLAEVRAELEAITGQATML